MTHKQFRTALVMTLALLVTTGAAQSPEDGAEDRALPVLWSYSLGSDALDTATAITLDDAGHVIVVGITEGSAAGAPQGVRDIVVVKLTAAGDEMWRRQLGDTGDDEATAVVTDDAGAIWIAGTTRDAGADGDIVLFKLSADGALLWWQRYADAGDEEVADVAFGAENLYLVGAQTRGDETQMLVMAVGRAGELRWRQRVVRDEASEAHAVAVIDGEVVVGGSSRSSATFTVPNNEEVERNVYEALRSCIDLEGTLLGVRAVSMPVVTGSFQYIPFRPTEMSVLDDRLYVLARRSAGNDFGSGGVYVNLFDIRAADLDTGAGASEVRLAGRRLWTVFASPEPKGLSVADEGRVYAGGPFVTSYLAGEDDAPFIDLAPLGWHASALVYEDGALYGAGYNRRGGEMSAFRPTGESDLVVFKLGVGR